MDPNPIENSSIDESAVLSHREEEGIEPAEGKGEKKGKRWVTLVIFGILITLIAWVAMVYNEYVSFGASALGLVGSVAGAILVGKGTWRSLAITSAIAAGVLFLVFVMLWAALSMI